MTRRSASASCARPLDEPLRWIAENGGVNGYVVTTKVRELGVGNGYNAATEEYGDLVAQGVLDPVKVTRSALVNASLDRGHAAHDRDPDRREARGRGARRPATATGTATVTDRTTRPR